MPKFGFLNFDKPKTVGEWIIFLAAVGITLSSPAGTRAFLRELAKYVFKDTDARQDSINIGDRAKLSQALYNLKKRRMIKVTEKNGKTTIELTENGKRRKLQYDLENLKIPRPASWDGKWRFLMFDIPESKKISREALRKKLKDLGFCRFQKSVWVYPYPCEAEIDFIAEFFSIAPYLNFLTVSLENDRPLQTYFKL